MLVAGGCEFDIKPRHIHSFVKRLLGSSYEPSTGFSAWEIWAEKKKKRWNPWPGGTDSLMGEEENKE